MPQDRQVHLRNNIDSEVAKINYIYKQNNLSNLYFGWRDFLY
jgi:hypothetical protein